MTKTETNSKKSDNRLQCLKTMFCVHFLKQQIIATHSHLPKKCEYSSITIWTTLIYRSEDEESFWQQTYRPRRTLCRMLINAESFWRRTSFNSMFTCTHLDHDFACIKQEPYSRMNFLPHYDLIMVRDISTELNYI